MEMRIAMMCSLAGMLTVGCAGAMMSAMGGKEIPQVPATEAPTPKDAGSGWFCVPTKISGRQGSFCTRSMDECRKKADDTNSSNANETSAGECRRQETATCKYLWVQGGKDGAHLCYMSNSDCTSDPAGKYGYEGDKTSACADYK